MPQKSQDTVLSSSRLEKEDTEGAEKGSEWHLATSAPMSLTQTLCCARVESLIRAFRSGQGLLLSVSLFVFPRIVKLHSLHGKLLYQYLNICNKKKFEK